jgi:eukaryotic-like serine/threonine-protein kinase
MERSVSSGKFILQEKLNESATTSVFKAHQSVLERTVLLKILHKHLADDHRLVERFTREARACALIRSDNIVQVYDLTEIDGATAIVMEFVEGTSLKDVLAAQGAMSVERTRSIAVETLRALKAAHARGVIHRDIKPGNMLVTESGHIKVTDFGLAAVTAAQTVTMEGAVLGTPAYLPPEHIRGEAADERSDLFSLGATLIEVVSGKRIFEGPTYSACINNILHFDPASVTALVGDEQLAGVIRKLMEPDRSLRYQSASEALDALETAGAASHIQAGPARASAETEGAAQKGGLPNVSSTTRAGVARIAAVIVILCAAALAYWLATRSGRNAEFLQQGGGLTISQADSTKVSGQAAPSIASPPVLRQGDGAPRSDTQKSVSPRSEPGIRSGKTTAGRDSSSLAVTCIPWAKVFLDSQYIGETPISGTVPIKAGTHTVSFANPQFMPIVKTITAAPGARVTASGNFFENAGYVFITVAPWAEVYIDDQYRDTTPIEKPMAVSAGKRRIRLHNPGFTDAVYEITVQKRDTLRLSYSLTRIK